MTVTKTRLYARVAAFIIFRRVSKADLAAASCARNKSSFISHPYNLKRAGDIHEKCSNCGVKYAKEPGFYYGAMYVSYALMVALFVTLWVSFNLFFEEINIYVQLSIIIAAFLVLTPYMYALSKIIWANLFIKYEKK